MVSNSRPVKEVDKDMYSVSFPLKFPVVSSSVTRAYNYNYMIAKVHIIFNCIVEILLIMILMHIPKKNDNQGQKK